MLIEKLSNCRLKLFSYTLLTTECVYANILIEVIYLFFFQNAVLFDAAYDLLAFFFNQSFQFFVIIGMELIKLMTFFFIVSVLFWLRTNSVTSVQSILMICNRNWTVSEKFHRQSC